MPTFDLFGRYCTGELASRDEVALIFRAADLHVSASRMETVGFTVPWLGIALALMAKSSRHKLKWYHVRWHITSHDCTGGTTKSTQLRIMLWTLAIALFCFQMSTNASSTHQSFRQIGQLCWGHGVYQLWHTNASSKRSGLCNVPHAWCQCNSDALCLGILVCTMQHSKIPEHPWT